MNNDLLNTRTTDLHELIFNIHQDRAESLSDALLWAGAVSVVIEDAHALTEYEEPLFAEPGLEPIVPAWALNTVIATIENLSDLSDLLIHASHLYEDALPDYAIRLVPQLNWVRLTQSQFQPIKISSNLWIVPSWHKTNHVLNTNLSEQAICLELDPGLAFGTGSHPTTHLCLQWLDTYQSQLYKASVMDYGCGSGILGIAAEKLGADLVIGIDIDPQAIQSSINNAQYNQCKNSTWHLPNTILSEYTVVIANILTNPLKLLAPLLCQSVTQSGYIVLSGILTRQAEDVLTVYREFIPNINIWRSQEGWVCLMGQK